MIDKNLAFVKDQLAYHQRMADKHRGNDAFRHDKHSATAKKFSELVKFIENFPSTISTKANHAPNPTDLIQPSELKGLPDELIQQLSITDSDKEAFEIIDVIDDVGGTLSLDRIILAIFHKSGEIQERTKLNAKINRIMRKGMIWAIPGKKGVYTTSNPAEAKTSRASKALEEVSFIEPKQAR